jgi:hypothetical protein
MLDALSHLLSEAGRTSSGLPHSRAMPDGLNRTRDSAAFLLARQRVAVAREAAQGNVNPQLLLAALADDLAEVL